MFYECQLDSNCDNRDIRTISICNKEALVYLHKPRPCEDYSKMIFMNVTTFNFPEVATWKIEDYNSKMYGGDPFELSKSIYNSNEFLS